MDRGTAFQDWVESSAALASCMAAECVRELHAGVVRGRGDLGGSSPRQAEEKGGDADLGQQPSRK